MTLVPSGEAPALEHATKCCVKILRFKCDSDPATVPSFSGAGGTKSYFNSVFFIINTTERILYLQCYVSLGTSKAQNTTLVQYPYMLVCFVY